MNEKKDDSVRAIYNLLRYTVEDNDSVDKAIAILEKYGWRHESDLDPNERENERIWNPFGGDNE